MKREYFYVSMWAVAAVAGSAALGRWLMPSLVSNVTIATLVTVFCILSVVAIRYE